MTEGKSIFMMSFDAIFAIAFLGILIVCGSLNRGLWSTYERGELNKSEIAAYASMAAYDNSTVGGQDIVSLMTTSKGDPFVLIIDDYGTILACSYDMYTLNYELNEDCLHIDRTPGVTPQYLLDIMNSGALSGQLSMATNVVLYNYSGSTGVSASDMTKDFLDGNLCAAQGRYAKFDTMLVYDGNSSTIIGVIATKKP